MKIALGSVEGEVHLFLDGEGRDELIEYLSELEFPNDSKSHEHFHLFSEEWGMGQLTALNSPTREKFGLAPVHHLKVYMRPSEEDV
ncbi:hypothetical protein [uncultured Roseobacter sp.]|uniref:hypothetical protein n=1 Tax=uncultured Roseobacter sp. TaxID=114847 RepID=UPI0026072A07|nr:hypothetical protein [uncultured Roseobacter sp.]